MAPTQSREMTASVAHGSQSSSASSGRSFVSCNTPTKAIILSVFIDYIGLSHERPALDTIQKQASETLLRVVREMSEKYNTAINGMLRDLSRADLQWANVTESISGIADEIMKDGCFNWGRLAILVAFVLRVVESLQPPLDPEDVIKVADYLSDYIDERLGTKIKNIGGWQILRKKPADIKRLMVSMESLVTTFPPEKPHYETIVRNGLLGVLGFGVCSLALLAAR